jgi:hypothetical protein
MINYVYDYTTTGPDNDRWGGINASTIAPDMRHAMAYVQQLYPDRDIISLTRRNEIYVPQATKIEATKAERLLIAKD